MLKKYVIILLVLSIALLNIYTISYAVAVPVTEENLNTAFQEFISSESNNKNYNIKLENNVIKVTSDDGDFDIEYDLTNKPTFWITADIEQGMSYDEFKEKTGSLTNVMLAYIPVAKIQGVEYEDSFSYMATQLIQALFSGLSSTTNENTDDTYMIVDDDTEIEEGAKAIKESEFGLHVMEYVNSVYQDKSTFDDSDMYNTFEWITEKKDVTDTSCKLISTLTVNLDADFSQLIDYNETMSDAFLNSEITEENADYLIKLKVGQKCKIVSNEKIVGYETYGTACIEFEEENTEITGTEAGKTNGYLYIGEDNLKKSIYVIVEENSEDEIPEPITITIGETTTTKPIDDKEPATTKEDDDTTAKTPLPNTGIAGTILIIAILIISSTIFAIKNKHYKEI